MPTVFYKIGSISIIAFIFTAAISIYCAKAGYRLGEENDLGMLYGALLVVFVLSAIDAVLC